MREVVAHPARRDVGIPARAEHGAKARASTRLGVPARAGAAEHAGRAAMCAWGATREQGGDDGDEADA